MRFEYKTKCLKASEVVTFWAGKFIPEKFDEILNAEAAQGWELVTTFSITTGGSGFTSLRDVVLTFKRPR